MRFEVRSYFFLALLSAFFATNSVSAADFPDVPASHPYAEAIAYVRDNLVMTGYEDGTFRPEAPINRAELVKVLVLANKNYGAYSVCDPNHIYHFLDAGPNEWYSHYLCSAVTKRVVQGYPDGTFRPSASITFAEAAKVLTMDHLLVNATGFSELPVTSDPWYQTYVEFLTQRDAVPSPLPSVSHVLTRAEVAFMMHRLHVSQFIPPSYVGDYVSNELLGALPSADRGGRPTVILTDDYARYAFLTQENDVYLDDALLGKIDRKKLRPFFTPYNDFVYVSPTENNQFRLAINEHKGPTLDAISRVSVSNNGQIIAYVGTRGSKHFIVVNQNIVRESSVAFEDLAVDDTGRVAYAITGEEYGVYIDGKLNATHVDVRFLQFLPNGTLAFLARSTDGWFVVIGDQATYYKGDIYSLHTANGHYAFRVKPNPYSSQTFVVHDGKRLSTNRGLDDHILLSPSGHAVAYMIIDGPIGTRNEVVVQNDTIMGRYMDVDGLRWTLGGRLVFWGKKKENDRVLVIDGKEQKDLSGSLVGISRNGDVFAYVMHEKQLQYVIAGGREGERYDHIWQPVFTDDGSAVMYAAQRGADLFRVTHRIR